MGALFPSTHNYTTRGTGSYVGGKWVEGTETPSTFLGDIQEMSQKEIETLPIGKDNIGKVKIYTDQVFNIAEETTNQNGDLVEYNGENYEIILKNNWDHGLLNHIYYVAELRKNV